MGACWWEPAGGSLLVGACWWEPAGGSLLVGACWWEPAGGTLLVGACWWDPAGGTLLVGPCWWDPAGSLSLFLLRPTFIASMTTIAIIGAVWYFLTYRTGGRGVKGGDSGGVSAFNPFVSRNTWITCYHGDHCSHFSQTQMSKAKTTIITESTPGTMR